MADRTITVTATRTASLNNSYLANQGEEITLDVVLHASLWALGYDGYIDFELPDGTSYFKGPFDCSTGTIATTLGATDSILDVDGVVQWQFVLATTVGSVRTDKWKTKQYETKVFPSVGATSSAILPYIPQMVFPVQYPAANISLADVGENYAAVEVEAALAECARKRFYTKEAILTNCPPNVDTTMTNGYEYGFEFGKCELIGLVIRNASIGFNCIVFGRTAAGGIVLGAKNLETSAQDIYIQYTMMRTD